MNRCGFSACELAQDKKHERAEAAHALAQKTQNAPAHPGWNIARLEVSSRPNSLFISIEKINAIWTNAEVMLEFSSELWIEAAGHVGIDEIRHLPAGRLDRRLAG